MLSESAVSQRIRLQGAQRGCQIWRNNVGACVDENGRHIRYGLCNDSAALNKRVKSSDLIGITPKFVTLDMVGSIVGVFTAVECKRAGWTFSPNDERARAQAVFHELVRGVGGFAGFAQSEEDFLKIINEVK